MRRARKTEEILRTLGKNAMKTVEILDEILPNYHRSYLTAKRSLYKGAVAAKKDLKEMLAKQQFYSLLNQLKRQDLIKNEKTNKGTIWKATISGLKKLKLIQENKMNYVSESSDKLKIIIYDVPEKERQKRLWLHEALKMFEFRKLQKSVYIGKSQIPEKFLYDLHKKRILSYVHIFEVGKSGTVKELT